MNSEGTQPYIYVYLFSPKQWHPTPVLLPGKSHGRRSLVGLQSMGSLKVRHNWATSLSLFNFMHWRRKWQPAPVFLPRESQGWGSLVGCCLWGCRVRHDGSDLVAAAAELCYVIPMALVQTDLGQAWPTGGSKWKQPVIRKCPVETNAWNTWSFVFEDGPIIL